jgi:addiction module HigA family antidote
MPLKNPPHPGDLIRTEVIEALGLSVSKAAEVLKVRRATLSDLLRGKAALTGEMALRIEKAFGPDMDHLLRMQLAYDVAKTRQHARSIVVKRYIPPAASAGASPHSVRLQETRHPRIAPASRTARGPSRG